jgi:hypothetical protein
MKSFPKSLVLAPLLLAMAALPCIPAFAADASPSASPVAKKETRFPFHGKLQSVDDSAMTFTLAGKTPRVFAVTAETRIKKNGQAATLKDAAVGDDVGGYTAKSADGKLTALSVRFGPRPEAGKGSPSPSGSVSAQ